jgi:hypothetical protein
MQLRILRLNGKISGVDWICSLTRNFLTMATLLPLAFSLLKNQERAIFTEESKSMTRDYLSYNQGQ